MKCKTVTLRKRKIKNGTQYSLCLDYYPGYRDNATMKIITREALGIYIFAKPANQQEKEFNARMMKKATILRNQRYEAIFNENHGFFDKNRMKGDFLAYFKGLADKKNIKWQHVYKHFERFVDGKCTFDEVDVDLCRKFMEYLLDAPQSIHTNRKLHINSAAGYWSTFRAVLHTAYRDRKIKENPNPFLDRIECIPTIKEHLSEDELIRLAETPCEEDVLRRVFLFGCLTGIRKSDYDEKTVAVFDEKTAEKGFTKKLREILPKVLVAGENAGYLTEKGVAMLDESLELCVGIPFAPCEGDAGTGMTATNSVKERTGNISAGTSIFAMIVLEKQLSRVYPEIDMVTTPTGKPVAMVHCNNCTSDLNACSNIISRISPLDISLPKIPANSPKRFAQLYDTIMD